MKKNNDWIAIMLAIVMTFLMTWISLFILSYIKPFASQTKSIENSVEAYYVSYSWVERALFQNWEITTWEWTVKAYNELWKKINTQIVPSAWEWDSEFDKNYNILKVGQPLELTFNKPTSSSITTRTKLDIKVPNLDFNSTTTERLQTPAKDFILNWTISWTDKNTWDKVTLQANPTGGIITTSQINGLEFSIDGLTWINTTKNILSQDINDFYNSLRDGQEVKIKFTLISHDLMTLTSKKIPYLEARLDFSWDNLSVEDRFVNINSSGRVYGFEKNIKVRVPSETTSEAYDFTIFQ